MNKIALNLPVDKPSLKCKGNVSYASNSLFKQIYSC